jgi:VWFA-related protein
MTHLGRFKGYQWQRAAWPALLLVLSGCAASTPATQSSASAAPAEKVQCPQAVAAPADLAKQPNYRQVSIAVHGQGKLPPPKLTLADLRLYQDGKAVPIGFLQPIPVTVGILVDTSGSMTTKLPRTREALTDFINDLNPADELFLFAFSDRVFRLRAPTTDHQAVLDKLSILHAFGRTALYDAILDGLVMVSRGCYESRALLVVTDGMDTASVSTLQQVVSEARGKGVPIYSIGVGQLDSGPPPYFFGRPVGLISSDANSMYVKPLQELASQTNGETVLVMPFGKEDFFTQAVTAIAAKLASQYTVGFVGDGSTEHLRFDAPGASGVSVTANPAGGGSL